MDEKNGIYIPDAICSAVQIVRKFIDCDCTNEDCPFDRLVLAVSSQEEAQRKEREQEAYERQREIELKQENQLE